MNALPLPTKLCETEKKKSKKRETIPQSGVKQMQNHFKKEKKKKKGSGKEHITKTQIRASFFFPSA